MVLGRTRSTPTGHPWLSAPSGALPRRGPNRLLLVVLALSILAIVLWVAARPPVLNPFADRTVDRSPPALLQAISDLSVYKAATGDFQTIVDIEKDSPLLPPAIAPAAVTTAAAIHTSHRAPRLVTTA